jgi:hypothetical protein
MKQKALLLLPLLALLPFVGWAQQKNYFGQHVSIKQTTGDSIQYDFIANSAGIKPEIRDGKVVWSFRDWAEKEGSSNHETEPKEKFAIGNVESIDFRSFEYDEEVVRKALIDFYHAMDGDNWPEEYKKNWCSDKPIWEWFGVNDSGNDWELMRQVPWVRTLNINALGGYYNSGENEAFNFSGPIPESVQRMGPMVELSLGVDNLTGPIPDYLGNIYTLQDIGLNGNWLSGTIPENLSRLPYIWTVGLSRNKLDGTFPEQPLLSLIDKTGSTNNFIFSENNFSGKVPLAIRNHPHYADFWPTVLVQHGGMDLSDPIPAPSNTIKDINGKTFNMQEIYQKNKYTLIYRWGWWCGWSNLFNEKLIPYYKAYKEKDMGFEIVGFEVGEYDGYPEYLKTHEIPWINIWVWDYEEEPAFLRFYAQVPKIHLVDQNGNIVFTELLDENGCLPEDGLDRRNQIFTFLEEHLGKVDPSFYTSTDYSHDGEVETLQTATVGQGIDLVFVGEGFTDKDIVEGKYDQRMNDVLEEFFTYEPYTSLRDRFNVYVVKAVSPNAEFWGNATHAIDESDAKAFEYALKVPNLIPNRPMRVNVIYNNNGGRSHCVMYEDDSYVVYDMEGLTGSNVLNHEAGGHGIGRLQDEYVEDDGEHWTTIPEDVKDYMENQWTTLGWGANVDWRSDPTEVKWAKFISDSRYADENNGVYEGSYLYQYGAYRPTENSMMRYNDTPFNAPSREEIYKRVMKESEGDSWTYDYETFVAFDAPGHEQFVNSLKSASRARGENGPKAQILQRTAPPMFLKGTWRDALNKKQK